MGDLQSTYPVVSIRSSTQVLAALILGVAALDRPDDFVEEIWRRQL